MKRIGLLLVLFVAIFSVSAMAQNAESVIKMTKEKYDVGNIPQGTPINFDMEFTNISKKPVVIETVMAGCGCTVPEKPKQPILPGKKGVIKVSYDAKAAGPINKDVEIKIAGIAEPLVIYFTGKVVPATK